MNYLDIPKRTRVRRTKAAVSIDKIGDAEKPRDGVDQIAVLMRRRLAKHLDDASFCHH